MITHIKINGFKSFHNFEMDFTPFTVIAGANASGKSNLFDALKLLSRLAESDNIKKAFKEQRGEYIELFTQIGANDYVSEMAFEVEMLVNKSVKDAWGKEAKLKYTRLRYVIKIKRMLNHLGVENLIVVYEYLERLPQETDKWIKIIGNDNLHIWKPKVLSGRRSVPYIQTIEEESGVLTVEVPQDILRSEGKRPKRRFPLNNATRTVLSSFDTVDYPHVFAAKEEMKSWKFLELNPEDLRQPTSKNYGDDVLSQTGKNLAAVLYRIKQEDNYSLKTILRKLQTFLPDFIEIDAFDDVENKQYVIKLKDKNKREYSSRVLSEGTLRILALCILQYDDKHTGLLCFEEPENGVHPFRIKDMVNLLKDLCTDFSNAEIPLRQVIINTHSPVLVNSIYSWKNDDKVTIWYAVMRDRVDTIEQKRLNMSVTKISKVLKENEIDFEDPNQKHTLTTIKRYLETTSSQF